MKTVYLILDPKGKPSSVSLTQPKPDPNTGRMRVLKPDETFIPLKLKSGQSIHSWSE